MVYPFLRFDFGFDFPAFDKAMATAWPCGLPAAISVLMLAEIVFRDDPRFSGMARETNGNRGVGRS
jgi:hypothetical protein